MNGQAIFDAAIKTFEALILVTQKRDRLRKLVNQSRPCCGNCFFGMKSSLCPKEHNVAGYNRGPSMNGNACQKFERTQLAKEALETWQRESNI